MDVRGYMRGGEVEEERGEVVLGIGSSRNAKGSGGAWSRVTSEIYAIISISRAFKQPCGAYVIPYLAATLRAKGKINCTGFA